MSEPLPATAAASDRTTDRPQLEQRLDEATSHERQQALRALLRQPLLAAGSDHDQELELIRRHRDWLHEWLGRNTGWTLRVDSEVARLVKRPGDLDDATRPARDPRHHAPFTRRRYVLLCLALASLERSERQTTLGSVADAVVEAVAADPVLAEAGIELTLDSRDQRRDLVQVMRTLLELRVLERVHGDEEQYLHERGDVLYTINRPVLTSMLAVSRGPSTIEADDLEGRLAALTEEVTPETESARNRRIRTTLTRRLLDDPVLYLDQLAPDELAYLRGQRAQLLGQVEAATGLVREVRREGIAMVDERGDLTDLALPEEGTDGHLTLLLAEHLAAVARERPGAPVSLTSLHRHVAGLIERHRRIWRKNVAEPGAEIALTERTVDRLEALRLVRRTAGGVVPLPAVARFGLARSAQTTEADG
jgi:uncharacterized protein (TIGR02678 family)